MAIPLEAMGFEQSTEVLSEYERGVRDGRAYMNELRGIVLEQASTSEQVAKFRESLTVPMIFVNMALWAIVGALVFK